MNRTIKNNYFFPTYRALPVLVLATICGIFVCGCSNRDASIENDLQLSIAKVKGKILDIPVYKPYTATGYLLQNVADPFGSTKAQIAGKTDGSPERDRPDMKRDRQPMEAFPLEAMEFNGNIVKQGTMHALVAVHEKMYAVKIGEYLGQNFGRIMKISETEVVITEKVQEFSGDWVERTSRLGLSTPGK